MYPANPFGDIVVPHEEGIVVNDVEGAEGYDLQQDQFTGLGDMIRKALYTAVGGGPWPVQEYETRGPIVFAGDDGLGMVQAQRLKQRMLASGRTLRVTQPYAVEADSPYQFEGFSFKRLFKPPKALRKFQLGRFIGRKVVPFTAGGLPGLFLAGKLFKKSGAPGVPTPSGDIVAPVGSATAPAPAPGPMTDVTGAPAPYLPSAPSPIPAGGGGSATEDVAAAAQASGPVAEASMLPAGLSPMTVGLGILAILFATGALGGKRRRR